MTQEAITVYQTDSNGWFVGEALAYESPLEPGIFLIPAGAYADPIPDFAMGERPRRIDKDTWKNSQWPEPVTSEPEPLRKPSSCTPAQGLVALFALKNITEDTVLDAIAQIPDPVQQYTAKIGYQRATTWERDSPTMLAMAQLLQLSSEELDELFAYAVTV